MKTIRCILLLITIFIGGSNCKKSSGNETTPKMSFNDVSMAEGTGGVSQAVLTLTLDHASSKPLSVVYSTIAVSAKAGQDFIAATSQTITFQPNETEKKITIDIVADDVKEADEDFQVRVESPVNVILLKGTVTVQLKNDDTKIPFNNTGYDAPITYPGYTLTWSDEFNGTTLNAATWTAETGDGCPGVCGWGNNELEYYMQPPNNLFFQDGKMVIEAKAETYGGKNYTSSRIKTQSKQSFQYGRIDIRAILPTGRGVWPALWMLPQDNVYGGWPKSGEIDIMEQIGSEPSKVSGTVHFGPGPGSIYVSKSHSLSGATFHDEFHVFSLEWKADEVKWYVDNTLYATFTKADAGANIYPFNEKFFFVVNLAIGGNFPGAPDASTTFPQWLIVDYIRVYQP